jgi:hypothetical protein
MLLNTHPAKGFNSPHPNRSAGCRLPPALSLAGQAITLLSLSLALAGVLAAHGQVTNVDSKPPKRRLTSPRQEPSAKGSRKTRSIKKPLPDDVARYPAGQSDTPSVPVRNGKRVPGWMVSFADGSSCGGDASIYLFNQSQQNLERALVLRCVSDLRQNGTYTNDYPEFVYLTNQPSGGQLYKAILWFDGTMYREKNCRTADASEPKQFVGCKCDGRGMVNPPGTEP